MERLSTNMIFSLMSVQVSDNQKEIINLTRKINEGKNFVTSYDNPVALIGSVETGGRILENDQITRNLNFSISELESSETPLRSIKDIMDRIKEIAITSSNGSTSADERIIFKNELRTLGETIVQLANTKVGDKFIFSGQQSNLQTLRLNDGASFNTAIYKHNQDDGKEKKINSLPTSISLKEALVGDSSSAKLISSTINPIVSSNGDLVLQINDGNDNITNFTTSLNSGDDLSSVISKINTAFNAAGGLGSIAQESPVGYLNFDTALVTGNAKNSKAMISIDKSSTSLLTDELNIKKQKVFGLEMGIMNTLADLESALVNNDPDAIRDLMDNLDFNLNQINSRISNVGVLISQAQMFQSSAEDLNIKLESDLSAIQDLDMIEANVKLNNAQSALQTSIRTSSNFFSYSLSNFLG
jgi:flagellar hook-associated protein 3 FlgL